jgi:hypothetical protein
MFKRESETFNGCHLLYLCPFNACKQANTWLLLATKKKADNVVPATIDINFTCYKYESEPDLVTLVSTHTNEATVERSGSISFFWSRYSVFGRKFERVARVLHLVDT